HLDGRRRPGPAPRASGRAGGLAGTDTIRSVQVIDQVYEVPQEHRDFQDTIRQIVADRVAPRAADIDENAEYPQDLRELFAEHDLFGLPFEQEYGGTGTGTL